MSNPGFACAFKEKGVRQMTEGGCTVTEISVLPGSFVH